MSRNLGDAFVRIRPDTSSFGSELRTQTGTQLAQAGQASGQAYAGGVEKSGIASRLGRVAKVAGVALGAAGLYGAAAFTKNAIGLEQAFGKTMSMFKANAGATAPQMRQMSALALQMGKDTVFSANDAAEAMLELAKNGMTPATIQAGALKEALTLAAAGGVGMEEAATVMGNALNAFGLKGRQANQVSAALAGAANASSASIRSLAFGLQAAATTAHDSGLSIQQTTAVLAAFENAGIKGSDAGTSLKTMLSRLVPQTAKASGAMRELGLKFTDSHGNFKSITNIAGQLHDKLGKLSDRERTTALNTIFGSDARRAATILMNQGTKGIAKYIKATSDQRAADRQAAAAMKGTAGAIEQRKGSVETLGLAFGQAIQPITIFANRMVADIANGAVPIVQLLGDKLKGFIRDAGGMDAVLGRVDLGAIFGRIKDAIAGIQWSDVSSGASSVGNAFGKVGTALQGVDWSKVKEAFGKSTADTINVMGVVVGFLADHLDELARAMPFVIAAFATYKVAQAAANVAALASLPIETARIVALFASARANKALTTAINQSSLAQNVNTTSKARGTIATIASTVASKAAAVAAKGWAIAQRVLNAVLRANPIGLVITGLTLLAAGLVLAYKKSETFRNIVNGAFKVVKSAAAAVLGFFKRHWPTILAILTGPIGIATALIIKNWDRIKGAGESVIGFVRGIPGKLRALGGAFADAGRAIISRFVDGIRNAGGVISGIAGNVWDAVRGLLNSAIDRVNAALEFTINPPGPGSITVNPPNIPHLWTGARVTRPTLAMVGDGREPETVMNDTMFEKALARAMAIGTTALRPTGGDGATVFELYDVDGVLVGRMRGEARKVVGASAAAAGRAF